ncbi:MAG TPA: arsenate reductase ArsC, partial [Puia sp.]|nr:arsenate reductase ArsC [Puia sp.]
KNSGRSQMAESFIREYGSDYFVAESAGIEPGELDPNVIKVMSEINVDINQNGTQSVFDLYTQGKSYNIVITVCDESHAEHCPLFPGLVRRLAWSFLDPSSFTGTPEEILAQTREVRDQIKMKILDFVKNGKELEYWIKPLDSTEPTATKMEA